MEQAVRYDAVIVHYQHSALITTHLLQSKTVHLICPSTFNLHFLFLVFNQSERLKFSEPLKVAGGVNYLQKWGGKNKSFKELKRPQLTHIPTPSTTTKYTTMTEMSAALLTTTFLVLNVSALFRYDHPK